MSVLDAVDHYEAMPTVEYAQPNYRKQIAATIPNDPRFPMLWGLNNTGDMGGTKDADIDAPEAWDITTGSEEVVIAVVDTGIDYNHPDLADNMWTNELEAVGLPGVDDDENGYIDDIHGWDAVNEDGDPMDDQGHGTHCAGTIGAQGDNGLGVVGVNWDVSIMALKFLGADGWGETVDVVEAFEYADTMGVKLLSNSWGGYYAIDQAEYDAIAAMGDALFFFAAGNNGKDNDGPSPHYPSSYDLDNILAVGASDGNDTRASFSNFGATTVDVFAPGVDILSTVPGEVAYTLDSMVWSDDFTDYAGWDLNNYGTRDWALDNTSYVSSPKSSSFLDYGNDEVAYTDWTTGIDVSSGELAVLRFDAWYDTEPDWDFLDVWYSPDGGTSWNYSAGFSGDSGGWDNNVEVVLSDQASGITQLLPSFGFWSDGSVNSDSGFVGARVDDPEIWTAHATGAVDYSAAYEFYNGTSMATPHVAGIAGLVMSVSTGLTVAELKTLLMDSVDAKLALTDSCVSGGRVNAYRALRFELDETDPIVSSNAVATYTDTAKITITATDETALKSISHKLDSASTVTTAKTGTSASVSVSTSVLGGHTLQFWATDAAGNQSTVKTANFEVVASEEPVDDEPIDLPDGLFRIAGSDRIATSVEASKKAYPGGADTVIVATGFNWPDALGGSALAGVVEGPLLLTQPDILPSAVAAEITRLGADRAYILGGTSAVSAAVETQLRSQLGSVTRLAGGDRYATARVIADRVVALSGAGFGGSAFVVTGANYPDALSGSPIAASQVMPILLANPATGAVYVPAVVDDVAILGGVSAVSSAVEGYLKTKLGSANVDRFGGSNRFHTAAIVAEYGVGRGLRWDGVGIATGENFPDALSAGAMLGVYDSVMLLTPSTLLDPYAKSALTTNRNSIDTVHIVGGTSAISDAVAAAVREAAGL
jgi:subtilisin family serine protease/putative cell wall-binding protein